ncbi:MAG: RdgB/HAM1 family non-canonical purine NTP pyrophosphatase [Limnobacter sp.]|nr:RdgB/HAM1 family non-canonical purine NTP pyrophosphatase [Limnobacter sp.]
MNEQQTNRWVLASGNLGKLKEFNKLFEPHQVQLVPQGELNVPECEEPHFTFIENALEKARHASAFTGLPALADDSGLCVSALKGAPGVHSARYATLFGQEKSDANNNAALIKQLDGATDRSAYFVCALVWVEHAKDPTPVIAQRMWWGEIQQAPSGQGGFGYDPHFYIPGQKKTASDLPPELKNQLSHRAQATKVLMKELSFRLGW